MTTALTITRLSDSAVINATPGAIWKTLRDFGAIAKWHPDVRDCVLEDGALGDRVGAVRLLHLRNGTPVRERITALSDKDMSYSYSVIESPMPLAYHSSTVSLQAIERGTKTLVTWYVEFDLAQGEPEETAGHVHSGVILPGFRGLANLVGGTSLVNDRRENNS